MLLRAYNIEIWLINKIKLLDLATMFGIIMTGENFSACT
jgi:hypothetical protein